MFSKGLDYTCTSSTSHAYTEGKTYRCYLNEQGVLCLKGNDGLEDPVKNLISKFTPKIKPARRKVE